MSTTLLSLKITKASIGPHNRCYRPPCWPPPDDWVVTENAQGDPISRWGDSSWDFSRWAGKVLKLNFNNVHNKSIGQLGPENERQLRLLTTWLIWGPRGLKSLQHIKANVIILRRLVLYCEREGVLASDLTRFPEMLANVPSLIHSAQDRKVLLVTLDRLLHAKEQIGFALVDAEGIAALARAFAEVKKKETEQTAYMPSRIWIYQLFRLRECLEDYLKHREKIENCFNFCIDAYAANMGSLESALTKRKKTPGDLPFTAKKTQNYGARHGRHYYGRFEVTAEKFEIDALLRKWVLPPRGQIDMKSFSLYLSLVQTAGRMYIANFTLQRKEEVGALRADCLKWEQTPVLGRIPVIVGETTKTDADSDARWPTSPSVELAVNAMTSVANLRMRCAIANPEVRCSEYDQANPYLSHAAFEPWSATAKGWRPYSIRPKLLPYQTVLVRFPRLFDIEKMKITEEDLITARKFTPNLDKGGRYAVGKPWPLAYHQLRRTGAINMFASGLLSDSSIQVIMKHLTLYQTQYYGANYSRARFNEDAGAETVAARYEVLGMQIEALVQERYVSPLGTERKQEMVVNLIGEKDYKMLAKSGMKGEVSFRETRLGGCTKRGHCDYGGIESVARCAGGDGDKPCRDAIFDSMKRSSVKRQLESVERRLAKAQPGSPRSRALAAEKNGLRNYLDIING